MAGREQLMVWIGLWYLLSVSSVIKVESAYTFAVRTPQHVTPLGGGVLSPSASVGYIFFPPQPYKDPSWYETLTDHAAAHNFQLGCGFKPCGKYNVDGTEANLVEFFATPRNFYIKNLTKPNETQQYILLFPQND